MLLYLLSVPMLFNSSKINASWFGNEEEKKNSIIDKFRSIFGTDPEPETSAVITDMVTDVTFMFKVGQKIIEIVNSTNPSHVDEVLLNALGEILYHYFEMKYPKTMDHNDRQAKATIVAKFLISSKGLFTSLGSVASVPGKIASWFGFSDGGEKKQDQHGYESITLNNNNANNQSAQSYNSFASTQQQNSSYDTPMQQQNSYSYSQQNSYQSPSGYQEDSKQTEYQSSQQPQGQNQSQFTTQQPSSPVPGENVRSNL